MSGDNSMMAELPREYQVRLDAACEGAMPSLCKAVDIAMEFERSEIWVPFNVPNHEGQYELFIRKRNSDGSFGEDPFNPKKISNYGLAMEMFIEFSICLDPSWSVAQAKAQWLEVSNKNGPVYKSWIAMARKTKEVLG